MSTPAFTPTLPHTVRDLPSPLRTVYDVNRALTTRQCFASGFRRFSIVFLQPVSYYIICLEIIYIYIYICYLIDYKSL